MKQWERQKKEIESYNTFYSAIVGRASERGLCDIGFVEIGRFVKITDDRNDVQTEPDYALYDGETLLLVEVKSGDNVEPRHIEQISEYNEISIESAEEFLKEAEAHDKGFQEITVDSIEGCIVYPPSCIEQCEMSDECIEMLETLSNEGAILTQDQNSQLELEKGSFEDKELTELLDTGIDTPMNPKKEVLLTEGMEPECISVSICIDVVASRLNNEEVKLTPGEVSNLYPQRKTSLEDIRTALEFLREIDACVKPDTEYLFRKSFLSEIMSVAEKLSNKDFNEFVESDNEGQKGLDQF